MNISLLWKKIKEGVKNFDFFALGNFAVLYYLVTFYLTPFLVFLGFPIEYRYSGLTVYKINYQALFYLAIGFVSMVAGYFSPLPKFSIKRLPNILKTEWNFKMVPWVFGGVFIIGIGAKFLRIFGGAYYHLVRTPWLTTSSWYGVVGYLDWFFYFALVIAFISYFHLKKNGDKRYRQWRVVAWGTFALEMLYAFPMCGRLEIIVPVILYLIVKFYFLNIPWWKIILIGLGLSIVLFPFGIVCRSPETLETYSVVEDIEDVRVVSDIADNRIVNIKKIPVFISDTFIARMDQSVLFLKLVEAELPSLRGKPLLKFFISFIPRPLWENKPTINIDGNAFGHLINILSPGDSMTSVGPTIVGDWYWNFGVVGIIFGMFFMGFLWRIFYEYLIKGTVLSLSGVFIYSVVFVQVVKGIENEIVSVYAGLAKFLIILLIIHFFLTWKSKKEL
ncbi:MAG: hypothetical protein AAB516_01335 [Patescibacteria group bacterium]